MVVEKNKELIDYGGPWQPFIRDIDPSTIQRINKNCVVEIHPRINYNNWEIKNKEWLESISDLPNPIKIIESESQEWIMLQGHINLIEQKLLGKDPYYIPQKQFWFLIKSYLVTDEKYDSILKWLSDKNFMGRWMPESHDRYELFNREYYWSPAYNFFKKEYYSGEEVGMIHDYKNDKDIGEVIVTAESYLWEAQYDFSKEEVFKLLKPCSKLVNGLNLKYRSNESYMYSESGKLICFDGSEGNSNHSCLYFRKKTLSDFLIANGYKIFWTILGEKNIIGGDDRDNYGQWPKASGIYKFINNEIIGSIKQY